MTSGSHILIFTDLDGTLLHHETYQWDAALPALEALKTKNIPLVLASSKTAAEIAPLRAELGFAHCPAIVENGAGLLAAHEEAGVQHDAEYQAIRKVLDELPENLRNHYRGFGDMGVAGIVETTGLSEQAATLAAKRAFSEPGLWDGSAEDQARFEAYLAKKSIKARSGGRFLTLSLGRSKADQMTRITAQLFEDETDVTTVALGDAPNDAEMLLAADRGFIVHNPHAKPIEFPEGANDSHVTYMSKAAPDGWNEAILSLLSSH